MGRVMDALEEGVSYLGFNILDTKKGNNPPIGDGRWIIPVCIKNPHIRRTDMGIRRHSLPPPDRPD